MTSFQTFNRHCADHYDETAGKWVFNKIACEGIIAGCFGITKIDGDWRVTHVKTGYRIQQLERSTQAATIAAALEASDKFDWNFEDGKDVIAASGMSQQGFIQLLHAMPYKTSAEARHA